MATSAYSVDKTRVFNELRRQTRARKGTAPEGAYAIKVQKQFVGADYDVVGDKIQLVQLPPRFKLLGASIVSDKEYDTGGTAARLDLILDDATGTSTTSAVGSAFTNQTANEKVELVSDAAGDTTQKVTVVGINNGTDAVTVEEITLNGTTPVESTYATFGVILACWVSSGTLTAASTVTVRETSGNATITTLTPSITSRGVNTVTSTSYYNRLVNIVASGTTTKQIGLKGTDDDGTVIYDSQALAGATQVQSNSYFQTVTEIYTGDLESNRTVTISPSEQVLVSASSAFSSVPAVPINFNGAAISGSCFGVDAGDQILALHVGVAPTTGNSGTVTLTATILGYITDANLPALGA